MRTLILIGIVLFGLVDLGHAQIYRQHEFHIAPSSLYVNEHVPEPILYYYSNEAGHLFRTRANDIDVFTTSLFPMG
ncbi:MAG TPA: hypothetical protein VFH43_04990, partial [Candidatus Kapabacteria bacterium]|nr:hypothetical protein [Candidatus Kapabacteria bacterium]